MLGLNTSGQSTDAERDGGRVFGVVRRYYKRIAASNKAWHQRKLTGVYQDAIELCGGSLVAAGGYVTTFGVTFGLVFTLFLKTMLLDLIRSGRAWDYAVLLWWAFAPFCVAWVGLYFEFFAPSESPIYFDRANRKVYYVSRSKRRRFILFGPSRIEARSVDWSLVDAEHQTTAGGSAVSVRSIDHLVFLMRTSATDPTIAGFYVIGNIEFPNELWEYIRAYMEEGAAPLMADEAPPVKGGEQFEMMAALRERKHNYWSDWKTRPLTMIWQHLALPLFVVFFVVNRLVVWSAQTVKWPPEVKPALGVPVTEADVQADRAHKLRAASPSAAPYQPRKKKH